MADYLSRLSSSTDNDDEDLIVFDSSPDAASSLRSNKNKNVKGRYQVSLELRDAVLAQIFSDHIDDFCHIVLNGSLIKSSSQRKTAE